MRPRYILLAVLLGALPAWVSVLRVTLPEVPDPGPQLEHARRLIEERFQEWSARVDGAAEALVKLWTDEGASKRAFFRNAAALVEEEEIDGVLILDADDRAVLWAGRTFDVSSREDFQFVRRGYAGDIRVLDRPAHRVLCAARPVKGDIAIAFLAFDERFPARRDLASDIEERTGLGRVRFQFGSTNDPSVDEDETGEADSSFILPNPGGGIGLCKVDLYIESETVQREKQAKRRELLDNTLFVLAGFFVAALLWVSLARRLPENHLLRPALAIALLVGLRYAVAVAGLPPGDYFRSEAPVDRLFAGPGNFALTAIVLLACALIALKTSVSERGKTSRLLLGAAALLGAFFLPRGYIAVVEQAIDSRHEVLLFNPLSVFPDLEAALALVSLFLVTITLFLCVRAASYWTRLWFLPPLAIALGALPWQGPVLGAGAALALWSLARGRSPPERVVALTFIAALTLFPVLFAAAEESRVEGIAERTHGLVSADRRTLLSDARDRITHPADGVDLMIATTIADPDADKRQLAFTIWEASRWDATEPCAVQVWDAEGRLLSTFDFDSPPQDLLPQEPPRSGRKELRTLEEPNAWGGLRYYAYDIPLRLPVEQRTVGYARISIPDRWDALLSGLRPSIFTEPLDRKLGAGTPPLLLADLDKDGRPRRTSDRTTTSLETIESKVLKEARARGFTSIETVYRGQDVRLILVATPDGFAAIVLRESLPRRASLAFAKVLLTGAVFCVIFLLANLVVRRIRPVFLFRYRVASVLILLSVPPVILLAAYNKSVAEARYLKEIDQRLLARLDLAQTLLEKPGGSISHKWCSAFASDHRADLNIYRGAELVATSRPGVWDTGLLTRRLDAEAYVELQVEKRGDYIGTEYFGRPDGLRAAYRTIHTGSSDEAVTLAVPALDDRRALEHAAAADNAILLGAYLLTAMLTLFIALFLARSLTAPVRELQIATRRVAAGNLEAPLPEGRSDEFGELVRAFNSMTRDLAEAQDLRVRAEKESAWREMARQIAHEIKNPLTPIKLTIQNLLASYEDGDTNFREQFLSGANRILDQIEVLRRIAGEFSTYARFPPARPEAVDVDELVRDVAALYSGAGGARVETDCETPAPKVRADRDELRRALINLVTNSRQADATEVALKIARDGDSVRLEITDDGTGIRPEVLDRIFEPSFTTKSSGTGLGLPIVKRVVDDLGGTIKIESGEGNGTTVVIRLPEAS